MSRRRIDPAHLAEGVLAGDPSAIARTITQIENSQPAGLEALRRIFPHTGSGHIIGMTGPPGAGKSSLVNELIRDARAADKKIAVLAIDPSSPITGGATLGDRIRMLEWHDDPGVFIRSMASRRFGGGLAQNTLTVAHVFDAAGFDPIIIETVGTGQDEVAIASLAHTTVLMQVPGLGDSVQTLKAGSLEIGDLIVVSKGDRPDAQALARDLRRLQTLREDVGQQISGWQPKIITTSATERSGIDTVVSGLWEHREWLQRTGEWDQRIRTMLGTEIAARVQRRLLETVMAEDQHHDAVIDQVLRRQLDPLTAAEQLIGQMHE